MISIVYLVLYFGLLVSFFKAKMIKKIDKKSLKLKFLRIAIDIKLNIDIKFKIKVRN